MQRVRLARDETIAPVEKNLNRQYANEVYSFCCTSVHQWSLLKFELVKSAANYQLEHLCTKTVANLRFKLEGLT